ncbi:MAG: hypothetical protein MUP21_05220 [Dehalococcoidia bacterium]|nr:hypothetical protein [Dehalococcoidia bacterium]
MKFLLLTFCLLFTSCVTMLDCPPGVEYGDECTTHWVPAPYGSGTPHAWLIYALADWLKESGRAQMEEERLAAEKVKAPLREAATNFITVNKE